jgi:ankyrin repeat protein
MEKGPIDWVDLHDKLRRGQVDLSQFLNDLDKKYWTERDQYGDTFLHIACFKNYL